MPSNQYTQTPVGHKNDALMKRLDIFASRIFNLCRELPPDSMARHIQDQLFRAGTSPGANFSEARVSGSKRDWSYKISLCLKELNETAFWLRLVRSSKLIPKDRLYDLIAECNELCRVFNAWRAKSLASKT